MTVRGRSTTIGRVERHRSRSTAPWCRHHPRPATGFPAVREHAPHNNFDSFIAVKRAVQGVRRCGSAAIDLCMVADGTYDAYWERSLHAWDTAAASAVVLGAGGVVTALGGDPVDHHVGHIAASNGLLHRALLAAIAS